MLLKQQSTRQLSYILSLGILLGIFCTNLSSFSFENHEPFLVTVLSSDFDLSPPNITEGVNNERNPDFDQSEIFLDFYAWEPSGAAGVNTSSYYFKYQINNTGWDYPEANNRNVTKVGISVDLSFRLQHTIFEGLGTQINYIFFVADNIGNNRTINRTLFVVDRVIPAIQETSLSNYSIVYTFRDAKFVMNVNDQIGASGIKNVTLHWMNGTDIFVYGAQTNVIISPTLVNNSYYTFILNKTYINANGFTVCIRAYDNAGNFVDWKKNNFLIKTTLQTTVINFYLNYSNYPYLNANRTNFNIVLNDPAYMGYSLTNNPNITRVISKNITTTFYFPIDGNYTIYVFYDEQVWQRDIIIDTISPSKVDSVKVKKDGKNHTITWSLPKNLTEQAPVKYRVYRGENESFTINQGILVVETNQLSYSYEFNKPGNFYYKIIVVDMALNPSQTSPASNSISENDASFIGMVVGIIGGAVVVAVAAVILIIKKKKFFGVGNEKPVKKVAPNLKPRPSITEKKPIKNKGYIPDELGGVSSRLSPEARALLSQEKPKDLKPKLKQPLKEPKPNELPKNPQKSKIDDIIDDVIDDKEW
jgi:hypothetical protein